MVSQISKSQTTPALPAETLAADIHYPDCDDQPMASNTEQYRWIVIIQQNLDWLLAEAFVAGDLFWYPIKGRSDISVAPDVMIALGRPKGKRLSYKQWEEDGVAPQVIFEILSPSNTRREMDAKLLFFHTHGVEEYYIYDTERNDFNGFVRDEFGLSSIEESDSDWVSPLLNIRFDMSGDELQLFRPDGTPFLSFQEVVAKVESAEERAESAEERAESAEEKAARLAEKLRTMGIDPDEI